MGPKFRLIIKLFRQFYNKVGQNIENSTVRYLDKRESDSVMWGEKRRRSIWEGKQADTT